ncbi:MAG: cytochrome c biogenesis protein CcsA [Candidatus Aminicenantes bacterium]|nr:cytochrome c biogenesis protein CcsA [Candidatus Aminicenantes bacterium]
MTAITKELKQADKNTVLELLKAVASLKLTVVCLILLAVLVVWGTVYQADHGLYQAQQKFFHSWFFLLFGFIPFPGTVLIMFILFFNLVAVLFFRIGFKLAKIGNLITHLGLIVLLVGGFFTFYYSQESTLTLKEGETGNMSSSNHLWELAVWEQKAKTGQSDVDVYAVDTKGLRPGDAIHLEELGLALHVKEYYGNCTAFTGSENAPMTTEISNASGIRELKGKHPGKEIENNVAGGVFDISAAPGQRQMLLLYGDDSQPTGLTVNNRAFLFSLRKKKFPLPLSLTLVDFTVKFYPNSEIAKSYESKVTIKAEGGVERDVVISMNKPLRYADLTFFQSSYYTAPDGTEYSILAVVKNVGRLLPYFSSIIIFLGLAIHFLVMLFKKNKENNSELIKSFGKSRNLFSKRFLVLLFVCLSLSFGSLPGWAQVNSLDELSRVVVLENGRKKPLDTYAQNLLKQFSGQGKFEGQPAIQWLARVLFSPGDSYDDKIFLITNPEVLDSMGVPREGKARDRYSFSQLSGSLPRLRQLAVNVSKIADKDRSFIENEIITLYSKVYIYRQLLESFQFLFPHRDFTIADAKILETLGLPITQKESSFLDLAEKVDKIQTLIAAFKDRDEKQWSAGEKEIFAVSQRMNEWAGEYRQLPLTIIPGAAQEKEADEKWLSPWDLLTSAYIHSHAPGRQIRMMQDFVLAYHENNQGLFDGSLKTFNQSVREQAGPRLRERAIALEVFYNRLDPFYKAEFFYGFSVIFLLLSFIVLKKWFYRFGFTLLAGGFLLHLCGVLARMVIMKRPPVTNLYETFIFTGLITALLGLILEFFKKRNIGILTGGLAGVVMLLIAGKYAMEGDTMGMLVAVLDSNFWLAFHVITIILGYAGIVLSGFIGHVYLLQKISRPDKADQLKNTFQAVYAIQAFGIVFTFLGTVLGGIWADQSWGRFWGWDPKENGALLILLWSAILFHARLAGWIKEIGLAFGTIIGVIAVSLAWFGVNLLGVGLHSYGFTSGVARSLFIFIAVELAFMCVTGFLLQIKMPAKHAKHTK